MKSIGDIYFDISFFEDEASKISNTPATGEDAMSIIMNRRQANGRLTQEGQIHLSKIRENLLSVFKANEIKIVWDRYCGCSVCPCKPGYRVKINMNVKSTNNYRFTLLVDKSGDYLFREPEFYFEIGKENVESLKKTFAK